MLEPLRQECLAGIRRAMASAPDNPYRDFFRESWEARLESINDIEQIVCPESREILVNTLQRVQVSPGKWQDILTLHKKLPSPESP